MDDGEIDFSDHDVFAACHDLPVMGSMESFLDELLKNTHSCTHTHTCNPPGPDNTHTHTCVHTHTQLFAPTEEEQSGDKSESQSDPSVLSGKKRPLGNKEAVRKYREKKKAHTAYLEEQVMQLRTLNQQLVRRLQGQATLEAEVVRLRSLLSEFRGRIDAELGSYLLQKPLLAPAQKVGDSILQPLPGGFVLNSFNVPCDADVPCLHSSVIGELGPSTPQDGKSIASGSGSCETIIDNCKGRGRRPAITKQKDGKDDYNLRTEDCVKEVFPV